MKTHSQFVDTIARALRQERLNARRLALAVGVDPSYISRMLAGERNPPSDELIEQIAATLRLDPDRLLLEGGRLPRFMKRFLNASGPVTPSDLQILKRAADQIRRRHHQSRGRRKS